MSPTVSRCPRGCWNVPRGGVVSLRVPSHPRRCQSGNRSVGVSPGLSGCPRGCRGVPRGVTLSPAVSGCPQECQVFPMLSPWVPHCPHGSHTVPTGFRLSPWVPHCSHGIHLSPPTRGCPLGAAVSPLSPEVPAELPRALPLLLGDAQHVQQGQPQALLLPRQAQPHGHAAPDEITAGLGGHRPQGGPHETPEPCRCHPRVPRGSHPAQARLSCHPSGDRATPPRELGVPPVPAVGGP